MGWGNVCAATTGAEEKDKEKEELLLEGRALNGNRVSEKRCNEGQRCQIPPPRMEDSKGHWNNKVQQ